MSKEMIMCPACGASIESSRIVGRPDETSAKCAKCGVAFTLGAARSAYRFHHAQETPPARARGAPEPETQSAGSAVAVSSKGSASGTSLPAGSAAESGIASTRISAVASTGFTTAQSNHEHVWDEVQYSPEGVYDWLNQPFEQLHKSLLCAKFKGDGKFLYKVGGAAQHQEHLVSLVGEHRKGGVEQQVEADMLMENDNPENSKAVAVVIGGLRVGYVDRDMALKLRRQHNDEVLFIRCQALINGGWLMPDGRKKDFLVHLDLPVEHLE
jgi:hypothetical protein